jgi:Fic family protein
VKASRSDNPCPAGLPRAIFSMFLVAEVHPFADRNGRVARCW